MPIPSITLQRTTLRSDAHSPSLAISLFSFRSNILPLLIVIQTTHQPPPTAASSPAPVDAPDACVPARFVHVLDFRGSSSLGISISVPCTDREQSLSPSMALHSQGLN